MGHCNDAQMMEIREIDAAWATRNGEILDASECLVTPTENAVRNLMLDFTRRIFFGDDLSALSG